MIFDLMRNGLSIELVINLCVRVFIIFCVLPIHEYAHGFVAHILGDDTARLKVIQLQLVQNNLFRHLEMA